MSPFTVQLVHRDTELIAEDEQVFLMKQQTMLSKQPTAGQRVGVPAALLADGCSYFMLYLLPRDV